MTTEPIPTVRLRNGTEEPQAVVLTTMMTLEGFMEDGKPLLLVELAQLARNPLQRVDPPIGARLCRFGLLERTVVEPETASGAYKLHDSIANIVLNATEGEGGDMHLVNPIAPQPPAESEVRP